MDVLGTSYMVKQQSREMREIYSEITCIATKEGHRVHISRDWLELLQIIKRITYQAETQNHRGPEANIVQGFAAANPLRALKDDNRQLEHLTHEAVPAELLGDAGHDNLVANGRDEKGQRCGCTLAYAGP